MAPCRRNMGTYATSTTFDWRQRRLSRFVMGKGLKVPSTCADRRDGGPSWTYEWQVCALQERTDITKEDNNELPATHIT